MSNHDSHLPISVPQVMVSSTFLDLEQHREIMMNAINKYGLHPNVMEHDSASPDKNVIESSLRMVQESAAYVLIIGHRYGQTPKCPAANPDQLSITELEFDEAQRLGRPILLYIMGDEHDVKLKGIETDADKIAKLTKFRKRAQQASPTTSVDRVYKVFHNLDQFREATASLHKLRQKLVPADQMITDPRHWDDLHGEDMPFDHRANLHAVLSPARVESFLDDKHNRIQVQRDFLVGLSAEELLRRFGFIAGDGGICNGAFLCFGESPSDCFPGATIKCFEWRGTTGQSGMHSDCEFRAGLLDQFDGAMVFLRDTLKLGRNITDDGRMDEFEIPMAVLEEVVANALVHRDYENKFSSVQISVYDDRVEVANPGLLSPPLKINKLAETTVSVPRNPQIARIFYLAGKVERAASGIRRIHSLLKERELPDPEFKETDDGCFVVVLRRPESEKKNVLPPPVTRTLIPEPPAYYAEPVYIGSHQFVGRTSELESLSDWAKPADPTNLLLFEAIGGSGKSMLTWEWATQHAPQARKDWAGRFWYSFYERGALMADFCRRALAYMTGQSLEELKKKKTTDLVEPLLAALHAEPWLVILDGLERVLVAYHRMDAAMLSDEAADHPTDKIANRNPCDAIREEDNDLLRALAAVAPSKILVSSRLTPRVLLNPANQPINGAKRFTLGGLRPADAEQLLRSCGIQGESEAIQSYLTTNCDNHPLVIGILGGLIANYLPSRGNFDAWAADTSGGANLDLANLDMVQRRNHILRAAIDDLPPASGQLLSTFALLSEAVDYETLSAFNPHDGTDELKLSATVADLEQRGLLQYEGNRYDLHQVVRCVAAGATGEEDKQRYGKRVVDYFSSLPHNPYEEAETLEDLRPGLNVVRTFLNLAQYQEAVDAYRGNLADALLFNLEAHSEGLSLLRPYFPLGWSELPEGIHRADAAYLANHAGLSLIDCGEAQEARALLVANLNAHLADKDKNWRAVRIGLSNLRHTFGYSLSIQLRIDSLALRLATAIESAEDVFMARLFLFATQWRLGNWAEAESTWQQLDAMGRDWSRSAYRPGDAEVHYAGFQYYKGSLQEEHLANAERLARDGKSRYAMRYLHWLRGSWRLDEWEWELAAVSFAEAVRMARERGIPDADSEMGLALAKFHLGQLDQPQREAERLAQLRHPKGRPLLQRLLAQLWLAIGDHQQAKHHALEAYKLAWNDGEPYVHRYDLTKTTELLQEMNVPIPNLPPYDPAKDKPFPWELKIQEGIEQLEAEKKAKKAAEAKAKDDEA